MVRTFTRFMGNTLKLEIAFKVIKRSLKFKLRITDQHQFEIQPCLPATLSIPIPKLILEDENLILWST